MGIQVISTTSILVETSSCENLLLLAQQQSRANDESTSVMIQTQQPQWRSDESSDCCNCCAQEFSRWMRRRHHCRACGELVCAVCSPFWDVLPQFGYKSRVRVCKDCKSVGTSTSTSTNSSTNTPTDSSSSSSCSTRGGYSSCSEGYAMSSCGANSPADSAWGDCSVELDDQRLNDAVDVIAFHSSDKNSRLWYDYFVQSEAVNWLMDAQVVKSRASGATLFARLIEEGYITEKRGGNGHGHHRYGAARGPSVFYVLNDLISSDENRRSSYYDNGIHSETRRCYNCTRSYLEKLTSTPGFCSIDCQTNALIQRSDSARARQWM